MEKIETKRIEENEQDHIHQSPRETAGEREIIDHHQTTLECSARRKGMEVQGGKDHHRFHHVVDDWCKKLT